MARRGCWAASACTNWTRPPSVRSHISAERAYWSSSLGAWIFENGWRRTGWGQGEELRSLPGEDFPRASRAARLLPEGSEAAQADELRELADYVAELRQSGFNTIQLRIQYFKKFATPLFALVTGHDRYSFSFLTGSRGAMAGVVSASYRNRLLEREPALRADRQHQPVAGGGGACAPNAIFLLAAAYLMTRLRT